MITPNTLLQNRYLIKRRLAQGGMGAVYIAEAVHLDNLTVAVKETFFTDDRLRQQFKREAALLARSHHPALPTVLDHFTEDDGQFLVMEFIAGDDLATLLEQRLGETGEPFDWRQVMAWADRLLGALHYIHTRVPPIIHRDIKPHNLKITPQGELYLIDFGLSKEATTASRSGGSLHGYTMAYAPPEQMDGSGTDERSDLYSLGATLYHLLTGKPPMDAKVREEIIKHLMPDPLQPVHHVNQQVPFAVASMVAKAMAINREQRYQNAAAMRQELKPLLAATVLDEEAQRAKRLQEEQERQKKEEERQRQIEEERKREAEARLLAELQRREEAEIKRLEANRQLELEAQRQRQLEEQHRREEAARQRELEAQREAEANRRREIEERQRQADEEKRALEEREPTIPFGSRGKSAPIKPAVAADQPARRSRNLKIIVAVALIPILLLAIYLLFLRGQPETPPVANSNSGGEKPAPAADALRYAIEIEGIEGRASTFSLVSGKRFRLHFTPSANGFLYLIAPNDRKRLQTFLTAQPLQANTDFAFPGGDNWIDLGKEAQELRFTVVFSEKPITRLSFLAKDRSGELTSDQQQAFEILRDTANKPAPSVTANEVIESYQRGDKPVIFDIVFNNR